VVQDRTLISVEDLEVRYGERVILKDVNFTVDSGEVLVIVGGSGCGKSTLLRAMIGLLTPARGRIVISGVEVTQAEEDAIRRLRQNMGVLFQSSGLLGSLNLWENVALPLGEYTDLSPAGLDRLVRFKLGLVGLAGSNHLYPAELSGGMRKRAGLARAMALDPEVLFFDEPSAGLDPVTAAELDDLILNLNQGLGTTMVIVTHELSSIFAIADRVVMLDAEQKGIVAQGDPRDLRDNSGDVRVQRFFRRQPRHARAGCHLEAGAGES
jgi:phospholipid/cholesterol/gamma-HCH transport system ATP-binding protein